MAKVSVIMPIYNSDRFLRGAIDSLQAQTFTDWELLAVDDASTDGSVNIVRSFSRADSRIRLIQQSVNKGAAVSRNLGIESAQGRFISFLDSDDRWFPDKLEQQVRFMEDRDVAFTFSAYEKVHESRRPSTIMGVPLCIDYRELLKSNVIGCLTAMYDTAYFGKIYMPKTNREDFALWLNLLKRVDYAYGINQALAQYRVHDDSISANKFKAAKDTWDLYRSVERLPLLQSVFYFSHYVVRGVLRTKFPRASKRLGILNEGEKAQGRDGG